jgi:hypothetical protein
MVTCGAVMWRWPVMFKLSVKGSLPEAPNRNDGYMKLFDLIKATLLCGVFAFFVYSYPVVGQVLIIGTLSLLWLSCAHQAIQNMRRRRSA